jgi:Predicted nucleoside-diphosphate sugar epimerases
MFTGRTILITGGTGSFGHAVVKRLLRTDIKEIRILSRDEKKQDDMRKQFGNRKLKFFIGDVRDSQSLKESFYNTDFVFHAAALKQVPSCEIFPMEAVKTNIFGTENVLSAAIDHGVKKVICLSTDKAAYPINAMGISKAMSEKLAVAKSRLASSKSTVIGCTRFGNVMASRGSVIPLFIEQIKAGQTITVTHPDMTRFMMSLEDAVDLVLFAFMHAESGDILINKSPACTVGDLAMAIKDILKANNDIVVTGVRHGEKWHETLLTKEEAMIAEDLDNFYRIPADHRELSYSNDYQRWDSRPYLDREYSSSSTRRLQISEIKNKLLTLDCIQEAIGYQRGSVSSSI